MGEDGRMGAREGGRGNYEEHCHRVMGVVSLLLQQMLEGIQSYLCSAGSGMMTLSNL